MLKFLHGQYFANVLKKLIKCHFCGGGGLFYEVSSPRYNGIGMSIAKQNFRSSTGSGQSEIHELNNPIVVICEIHESKSHCGNMARGKGNGKALYIGLFRGILIPYCVD